MDIASTKGRVHQLMDIFDQRPELQCIAGGLAITREHGIGRLNDRLTLDHRRRAPMVVSPFVYRLEQRITPVLNHEIAATRWLSLAWLNEPVNRQTMRWRVGRASLPMPCYDCGDGQRLWGLTLAMLDELCGLVR